MGMMMLDLFCCEGIGAMGYGVTGLFDEIWGLDIDTKVYNRYPYTIMVGDALGCRYDFLYKFDFVHASPPCQGYSKATPKHAKHKHARLIAATHTMLRAWGGPYVIENVEGAGAELKPNLCLSGIDVGLPMERRRYFHIHGVKIDEKRFKRICAQKFTQSTMALVMPNGSQYVNRATLIEAYAMKENPHYDPLRVTRYGLEQGIPPRMTEAIAKIIFGVW